MAAAHRSPTADDDLRRLLTTVNDRGWDNPDGEALLRLLREKSRNWALAVDRHCRALPGTINPDDVMSIAWEKTTAVGRSIAAAERPWAYLWNVVRNAAAIELTADVVQSTRTASRARTLCRVSETPLRVGLDEHQLRAATAPTWSAGASWRWSPALEALLGILVAHGGSEAFWRDALDRAVEVLAGNRDSYREYELRRDPYLRDVLGLEPRQLSALAGLLIGTRRGDRRRQSLLLALHDDVETDPGDVDGALGRLGVLLAEPLLARAAAAAECPDEAPWLARLAG